MEYGTRVVRKKDGGSVFPVYGGGGETFKMDTFNREDRVVVSRFGVSETCVRRVEGKFFLNDSGLTIAARDAAKLLPAFLDYQLFALNDDIYRLCRGTAQKNLDVDAFRQVAIAVPDDVSEQRRIVAILDEAFEAIATAMANAEKNLANTDTIFQCARETRLSDPTWKEVRLGQFVDVKHGFPFDGDFFSHEGEHVLLTPGNFIEKGGYRDRGQKQKYYNGQIPPGYMLKKDDLLVAMTEQAAGLLGSPAFVPADNKFLHNQRLGLIQVLTHADISKRFLFHVFNTARFRAIVHKDASGVKVRHTSPNKLKSVIVRIPPMIDQVRVALELDGLADDISSLRSFYEEKLHLLSELRQSILGRAFGGNLNQSRLLDQAAE